MFFDYMVALNPLAASVDSSDNSNGAHPDDSFSNFNNKIADSYVIYLFSVFETVVKVDYKCQVTNQKACTARLRE